MHLLQSIYFMFDRRFILLFHYFIFMPLWSKIIDLLNISYYDSEL